MPDTSTEERTLTATEQRQYNEGRAAGEAGQPRPERADPDHLDGWDFGAELRAYRAEWNGGYEAGLDTQEGDEPPAERNGYRSGWKAGHAAARRLATERADWSDAEIDAGLSVTLMAPMEPDGGGPGGWPPLSAIFGGAR